MAARGINYEGGCEAVVFRGICFSLSFTMLGLSHLLAMLLSCRTQIASVLFALMQATPGLILCDHPRDALDES